jgi:DNA invertase Pin-like site-specific DNA recombinase
MAQRRRPEDWHYLLIVRGRFLSPPSLVADGSWLPPIVEEPTPGLVGGLATTRWPTIECVNVPSVNAAPTAAAIYARISSDPEHDQLGVTRQLDDCRALADRRDLRVIDQYVDDDRSAWSGKARPEYRRMLADIADGQVGAVLVWHTDRLHRRSKELEEYIEVCEPRSVPTYAVTSGEIDLSTADGRCFARILAAMATKESDDKSRRIRRKHEELAQAGKMAGGGTRPYGYQSDRRTIEPEEAAIVREAAERILAGDSLRSLASDLNDRGITTVTGKQWPVQVLRRMLLSARISGQREHHGEIIAPGDWDPIITPARTSRLRALLTDPERRTKRAARSYLLTGLLNCAICGSRLVSRPRQGGARRYICAKGPGLPGCGGVAILADTLERFIVEAILYRLDSPALAAALDGAGAPSESLAAVRLEAETSTRELEQLAAAYGERQITWTEFLAARKPIETRIEAAKRTLARQNRTTAVQPYVGASSTLREVWPTLPLSRQRAVVAALLDRAVIRRAVPGRTAFDESRVEPVWRV